MKKWMSNWDITRIARMVLGAGLCILAFVIGNYWLLLFGGFFILHAALGLPCFLCALLGTCKTKKNQENESLYKDQIKTYKR